MWYDTNIPEDQAAYIFTLNLRRRENLKPRSFHVVFITFSNIITLHSVNFSQFSC